MAATVDPSLHAFTLSGAFLVGAVIGAVACVRLVKYLTAYLRDDIKRRDRGEGPPTD